jgi:hypothetical protein
MTVDPYLVESNWRHTKRLWTLWKDSKVTCGPTNPGIYNETQVKENSLAVF